MEPQIRIKTSVPGPKSQEIRAREEKHLAPGLQRFAIMAGIVVDSASGSQVRDVDGNQYLDLIGGIGVNGLGHCHPKLIHALKVQMEKVMVGSFTSLARVELLEKLAQNSPSVGSRYRPQFYSSGAEAVESALRLAKSYTKKYEFVSFSGGFHGKTLGVLSLMGSDFKKKFGPFAPGAHVVPYADCYRCPMKLSYPSCGLACVEMMRNQIKNNSCDQVAAVIVEPMQGSAGNVLPPKDFLPAVKSITKEMNALFIADEMITGFGRTGKYWGVEHSGVEPDVLTIGKQFGGGVPLSGVLSKEEISQAEPWANPSGSSSSYGGNALVSAAAAKSLEIIEEEQLVKNSKEMGDYFLRKLKGFEDHYPFVGEVRGEGLFLAIELVKDRKTKEPLAKRICQDIFLNCLRKGLLTMSYEPRFRIQPALTIDEKTIDESVEVLAEVFDEMKDSGSWNK